MSERSEFALAPAARAAGPMRVAGAQKAPWDTPPARDSCGTMSWPRLPAPGSRLPPLGLSGSPPGYFFAVTRFSRERMISRS